MNKKIVVIGAGSAVFSLSIIKDICLSRKLNDSLLCLIDIDEQKLNAAFRLCERYAEEMGTNLKICKTTDREEGLKGADFVINSALVCNHEKIRDCLSVAEQLGYHYGSSLHIMHDEAFAINFYQLRLIEEIYLDKRRLAPDAWYILLANPMCMAITMLGRKYHDNKIVGLCQGPTTIHEIFRTLELDEQYIDYDMFGCNHFIWITKLMYKGKDAFHILDEWIAENRNKPDKLKNSLNLKSIDMYETYGALPIGDTFSPGGGSFGWWYHSDTDVEKSFGENPTKIWSDYYEECDNKVNDIIVNTSNELVRLTEIYPPEHSEEIVIDLIEALVSEDEAVLVVNLINDEEYVPGVPRDFNVETKALCSRSGIKGIHNESLPKAILGHLLSDRVGMIDVELEAYDRRDEELLVDLVMMDHQTKSRSQARELVNRILELEWNNEMKEYYRGEGAKRHHK